MKRLFSFFRFLRQSDELSIEDVSYKDDILYCKVKDFVSINPFVVPAIQILTDEALMEKFRRRDLLRLQEIQNQTPDDSHVKLIETFANQNKYMIAYHGQKFIMSGHDLCRDLKLLQSMAIADICKVVYETAYFTAQKDHKKNKEMEKQLHETLADYRNVIDLTAKFPGKK